jgi:hypothetical protein
MAARTVVPLPTAGEHSQATVEGVEAIPVLVRPLPLLAVATPVAVLGAQCGPDGFDSNQGDGSSLPL